MKTMTTLKTYVVMAAAAVALQGCAGEGAKTAAPAADSATAVRAMTLGDANTPADVAEAMGMGWNLGNSLDAWTAEGGLAAETAWSNAPSCQELFNLVAKAGVKTVRIPVTWLGHTGPAPEYKIDEAWLDRVAQVVGYAEAAGLNAIINIHHDGADGAHWLNIKGAAANAAVNKAVQAQLRAMWTQIAKKFQDKGPWLIFEVLNEIHDGGWGWGDNRNDGGKQYNTLNEWNAAAVEAIRATGRENATRWIAVPSYVTNFDFAVKYLKLPADPAKRLMVTIHFYDPNRYTLDAEFSEWGHLAAPDKKLNWGDEDNVRDIFAAMKTKFINAGTPVYIGEIGCVRRGDERSEAFRKYYLEFVCAAARTYCMAPIFWDNGYLGTGKEQSGLIDRKEVVFANDGEAVLKLMADAVNNKNLTLQQIEAEPIESYMEK